MHVKTGQGRHVRLEGGREPEDALNKTAARRAAATHWAARKGTRYNRPRGVYDNGAIRRDMRSTEEKLCMWKHGAQHGFQHACLRHTQRLQRLHRCSAAFERALGSAANSRSMGAGVRVGGRGLWRWSTPGAGKWTAGGAQRRWVLGE